MRRALLAAVVTLAACGSRPPDAIPPVTVAAPSSSETAPAASVGASVSIVAAPATEPTTLEAERRAILDELVAIDTSHGHESDVTAVVAARLERAGIHADLFESGPGHGNLVARVRGSGQKRPLLLLAHIDVVPVDGQPWTVPPFKTTQKEGFLWGRGVGDDKGMASAEIALLLELARTHAPLSRDVIVALTSGEETDAGGTRALLAQHRDLVDAELALNEGGFDVSSDDLSRVLGVGVSVSEKRFQSYKLVVHGPGGHSSLPPPGEDPAATLGQALVRVGAAKPPARVLPDVKDALTFLAAYQKEPLASAMRRAAASAPRLSPADEGILSSNAETNAMVRTTCVTTMLQGSPQDNVLPTTATATVNCRILPDDTSERTRTWLEHVVNDHRVTVEYLVPDDKHDGAGSPIDARVMDAVRAAAQARWPGAGAFATMLPGASDSRFLRGAGIAAYGIDTTPTSMAEDGAGHTAHGPDERAPLRWLDDGVRFLRDVVLTLAR